MQVPAAVPSRCALGVVAAIGALFFASTTPAAADVVVASNGGVWEQATRACFVDPYEKKTGKKAQVVLGTPAQWMNQISANPAKPPIDIIISSVDGVGETIKRGIVDPMTPANIPALKDADPRLLALGHGYGAVLAYSALGIAYNKNTIKNPPRTWEEFVNRTAKGEWNAAIPGMRQGSTPSAVLWMLASTNGGSVDNIEPGFDAIKRMKAGGKFRIWNDMNEFLSLMKTEEIDIGMYWEGRTWDFIDAGNPEIGFIKPKPGVVVNNAIVQKVKNGSDDAWDFLDLMLSVEGQSCFGNQIQYGVGNVKAKLSPKVAERITRSDEMLWPPYDRISPKVREWVERWNKEVDR